MKKFFLAAALVAVATVPAFADDDDFAPEAKDVSIELQFNPFSNNFSTFSLDNAKVNAKYFITEKHAIRLGLGVRLNNDKKNIDEDSRLNTGSNTEEGITTTTPGLHDSYTVKSGYEKANAGQFNLNVGYEYHFVNRGRLDLYAGAQVGLGLNWASYDSDVTTERTHWYNASNGWTYATDIRNDKSHKDGFNGSDSYKGLTYSAELGLRFASTGGSKWKENASYSATTYTYSAGWVAHNAYGNSSNEHNSTVDKTNLNFYAEPAIHIGWKF